MSDYLMVIFTGAGLVIDIIRLILEHKKSRPVPRED